MKIHYLITSLESGGAEAAVPRIVAVMRVAGHEVEVTACEPRDMAAAPLLDEAGIPYRLLFDSRRTKLATIEAFSLLIRPSLPDVIWTSLSAAGLVGMVTGAMLGIPVVSWKHSASMRLHTRLTRRLSHLWVTDSRSVADFLTRKLGMAEHTVMTWPLFEQPTFERRPSTWDGNGTLRIGSVGRLHPVKNYDFLIDAMARLSQSRPNLVQRIHLTIVGDGPERARLEQRIARHGLQATIDLPGAVSDVRPFLQSWHLYVQPSRYEGMCLAAHEAMSAGLPVIVTPVGELRESVRASGGGLFLEDDVVHSCAAAIEALMAHPERLADMGQAGRAYTERTYGRSAFAQAGLAVICRVEEIVAATAGRSDLMRSLGRS